MGLTPASLSFTVQQGGSNPPAKTLTISNTGGSALRWSISHDAPWLWHSPGTGTGAGAVTIGVTPGALLAGTYTGQVTLWPNGAPSVTVPVTFIVTAAPAPPAIGMTPTSLSFTAQQGGSNPPAQTVAITNKGGGTLTWSVADNTAWVAPSPASGTGNGLVTINVITGSLKAGTYNSMLTLNATGASSVTVPVTFIVTPAPDPPTIGMTPPSLSFTAQQGGSNPPAQTLTISNTGSNALGWGISHDAPWLWHSPGTGTGAGAVTIGVTPGALPAGTYTGQVTLWPNGAPSVTVPVTFTVTAAPVPPAIGASPTSLSVTAIQGGTNPAAQTLSIRNTGGGTMTWTASENTGWLTLTAGSGTGNGTMTLQATTGALAPGIHTGTVTLSGGAGVTPVALRVSMLL